MIVQKISHDHISDNFITLIGYIIYSVFLLTVLVHTSGVTIKDIPNREFWWCLKRYYNDKYDEHVIFWILMQLSNYRIFVYGIKGDSYIVHNHEIIIRLATLWSLAS